VALYHDLDDRVGLANALGHKGSCSRAGPGRAGPDGRLLGAAGPALSATGTSVPPTDRVTLERVVAGVRSRLGEAAFAAAWTAGQAITLEQAAAYALEDTPDAAWRPSANGTAGAAAPPAPASGR
jgi:hypothetical protein